MRHRRTAAELRHEAHLIAVERAKLFDGMDPNWGIISGLKMHIAFQKHIASVKKAIRGLDQKRAALLKLADARDVEEQQGRAR